ncbi:TIGR01906 family membrane protein [Companilactobacillus baiquanensis]|uniref:TIGR01906 family membrane protein n=1 Tax=Companilactobacillus baiquanensis TaxID=2486005 RepID=A0ABW1UW71_9LACO|nr:TIGR01906 family membrane protein [Companilactobacillus baiquanensis]
MSNSQKDVIYTTVLAFFIFTFAVTVTIFASYPLFMFAIKHYYLEQAVNLSFGKILHNYNQMMNYLINPFSGQFHLSDFSSSVAGRTHFSDVKKLFMLNFGVLILSSIYLWIRRKTRSHYNQVFKYIAIIGVILAILMAINFDGFFVIFHEVLFRNSDWLFDPEKDPIINVLPEEFFTQCFILFFVLFEGLNFWKYKSKK